MRYLLDTNICIYISKHQPPEVRDKLTSLKPDDFVPEVEIFRRGDEIVLRKKPDNLVGVFDLLAQMPEDFFADGREQPPLDERDDM